MRYATPLGLELLRWARSLEVHFGDRVLSLNDEPVERMSPRRFVELTEHCRPLRLLLQRARPQPPPESPRPAAAAAKTGPYVDDNRHLGRAAPGGRYSVSIEEHVASLGLALKPGRHQRLAVKAVSPGGWGDRSGVAVGHCVFAVDGASTKVGWSTTISVKRGKYSKIRTRYCSFQKHQQQHVCVCLKKT